MSQLYGQRSWRIPNQMGAAISLAMEVFDWVEAFPVSAQSRYSIRLAIEEMLSNTIKYAYDDDRDHFITIRVAAASDGIQIQLVDDGRPFDPTRHPKPDIARNIESGIDGGFGIELVRCVCKQMGYRRDQTCNCVTLHIGATDEDASSDSGCAVFAHPEESPP
jgi:serine/threonine-protein kinase RsbW